MMTEDDMYFYGLDSESISEMYNDIISIPACVLKLPMISGIIQKYYNELVIGSGMCENEFIHTMVQYVSIYNGFRFGIDYLMVKEYVKACMQTCNKVN